MSKELVEQYKKEFEELVERARKDNLVIEAILKGNQYKINPVMQIRPKTAEERLAEIEKKK